jgi:hypothetical protein
MREHTVQGRQCFRARRYYNNLQGWPLSYFPCPHCPMKWLQALKFSICTGTNCTRTLCLCTICTRMFCTGTFCTRMFCTGTFCTLVHYIPVQFVLLHDVPVQLLLVRYVPVQFVLVHHVPVFVDPGNIIAKLQGWPLSYFPRPHCPIKWLQALKIFNLYWYNLY